MLKTETKIKDIFITIMLIPIAVVFCIFLLFYLPIDFLKYINSSYYKNTKEKYYCFAVNDLNVKIYNIITENHLPIEFHRNDNYKKCAYGYFIYNDILIVNDFSFEYDNENNEWLYIQDDDGDYEYSFLSEKEIDNIFNECNEFFGCEKCRKIVFLTEAEDIPENAQTDFCRYEFKIINKNDYVSAIKEIIYETQ
ncbi:MAG: hypothetical protein NC122_10705 [Faecalibacterium sp.]|nr:hypothetical protein [Ruminococcus sp.]MCM1393192.1 hypothetical protein [Ruminococcus sp.]MCM1486660.1 hypothetical protein [Faecalibacterium sp.]